MSTARDGAPAHRYLSGMAGFVGKLGAEFAERRRRLRRALGDMRASIFEFVVLAGVLVGVFAPSFAPRGFAGVMFAPLIPVVALAGYLAIEAQRQRQPGEADAVQRSFDRRTLYFLIAMALLGFASIIWASLAEAPFELAPPEVPSDALPVTIGP
jgi:hypothetical protein